VVFGEFEHRAFPPSVLYAEHEEKSLPAMHIKEIVGEEDFEKKLKENKDKLVWHRRLSRNAQRLINPLEALSQ